MAAYQKTLKKAVILLIRFYRFTISLLIGHCCRFEPTCSYYAMQAFDQFGLMKAFRLSILRLLCCHPWHPGGDDPLPKQELSVSKN